MKPKGNTKRAGASPDFWKNYRTHLDVPEDLKSWVLNQYYDQVTLSVYCDASIKSDHSLIGVACSYISNGLIVVKQQYVQPPLYGENVPSLYAEIKGIVFALNFFEKYKGTCSEIVVYSDLIDIERMLGEEILFKKNMELQKVRKELRQLYKLKKARYGEKLQINYLPVEKRKFNHFYRSAHNAASNLVKG
ncbi:hypothetical protein FOA22_24525 [Heyndrickxia oleronia]|uniref:hypothetical protein n=1 Tax=Heyndrickxia oleronia TaxID=38875 RepID=UPI0033352C30